jgi:hypothetical protein
MAAEGVSEKVMPAWSSAARPGRVNVVGPVVDRAYD